MRRRKIRKGRAKEDPDGARAVPSAPEPQLEISRFWTRLLWQEEQENPLFSRPIPSGDFASRPPRPSRGSGGSLVPLPGSGTADRERTVPPYLQDAELQEIERRASRLRLCVDHPDGECHI